MLRARVLKWAFRLLVLTSAPGVMVDFISPSASADPLTRRGPSAVEEEFAGISGLGSLRKGLHSPSVWVTCTGESVIKADLGSSMSIVNPRPTLRRAKRSMQAFSEFCSNCGRLYACLLE